MLQPSAPILRSSLVDRLGLGLGLGLGACLLLALSGPVTAVAATPKDTLVIALAFDDIIISLDPAEAFEISAGELMGNGYDRLLRFDINDPSKLLPDLAKSWKVSADGKTYSFELKPGLKFASGNPLTAPGAAIFIVSLGFNLLGDGLRDAMDPKALP